MRPKSLILLILALGCGLVAAIGINQVMANRATQNTAAVGETTPIFVAVSDIGMGDPLTPQVLKLEEWPKGKVPPGAMDRLDGFWAAAVAGCVIGLIRGGFDEPARGLLIW